MKIKTLKSRKAIILSIAILASVIIITKSFGSILKMLYGIHSPAIETSATILNAAERYGIDTGNVVTVNDTAYEPILKSFSNSIPEAIIFDKAGMDIAYKQNDSACNAGLFAFIPALKAGIKYKYAGKTTLNNVLNSLRDVHGTRLSDSYLDTGADFYIFISWASYIGRLNKNHVNEWQVLAEKKNARIQVIAVNMDIQEWWGEGYKKQLLKRFGQL